MVRFTALLFTLMFFVQQASATDSWEQSFGPEGDRVFELNGTSSMLFAKAGSWFRSSDAGDTWETVSWSTVPAARVIKRSGNTFWMLDAAGTPYKSSDGVNWEEKSTGMTLPSYAVNLSVQGELVFVNTSAFDKTWVSTNGGDTWSLLNGSGISKPPRFVHQSGDHFLGWAYVDGLWVSTNQGESWTRSLMDDEPSYVYDFLETSSGLLVSTNYGIYLSTDNGVSFSHADSVKVNDMLLVGNEVLVATDQGAFWHSTDGSYLRKVSSSLNPPIIDELESANGLLLAATNAGVYRSADHGTTWTAANKGLGFSDIYAIDGQGDTLWLAADNGLWRSTTQGQKWVPITNLPASRMHHVWVSGDSILASGTRKIWMSINSGQDWTLLDTLPSTVSGAFSAVACQGTLFAGASLGDDAGIYRYSSGSWSLIRSENAQRIWCHDGQIFGGRSVSGDLGDNWSSFDGVGGRGNIYSYGALDGNIYLGAFPVAMAPVYRSSNGTSFTSFDNGIANVGTIYGITTYNDTLYVMANDGDNLDYLGVFKIWGSQTTWTLLGDKILSNNDLGDIHYTPSGLILGANNGKGLYRYDYSEPEPPADEQDNIDYPDVPTWIAPYTTTQVQTPFRVEQSQQSIHITPNAGSFRTNFSVEMRNARGKSALAKTTSATGVSNTSYSINTSTLQAGIYYVIIRSADKGSVLHSGAVTIIR